MHEKAVDLLKNMFSVYKISQKSKSVCLPIEKSHISQLRSLMIWLTVLGFTVYALKNINELWSIFSIFSIIFLSIGFIIFLINHSGRSCIQKIKIIFSTVKFLLEKLLWKFAGRIYFYFVRKKIKNISANMGTYYEKIHSFFKSKERLNLLEVLINEMRLPKENTYNYSVAISALIYDFENTGLFPSNEDLINKMKDYVVQKEDAKEVENIAFFKVGGKS